PPFAYEAVGREAVRFTPLGKTTQMTPGQILMEHEKGIAYAHLVGEQCPLITDKNGEVLSFPPIINGERTRLTSSSTDLLIDCTGLSEGVVRITVSILCAALADRGGHVEQVPINGKPYSLFDGSSWSLPEVKKQADRLLGTALSATDAARHLQRLGHSVSGSRISSPAFRADLLHEVDLVEDIAISIGLNSLPASLPAFSSLGAANSSAVPLHEAMLGLGYFEVMGWILVNARTLAAAQLDSSTSLQVRNPLTEDFTTLRPALYPNLLDIFAHSKSEPMPQYLYEIGPVLSPDGARHVQEERLCAAASHPKACFSESAAHLDGLLAALSVSLEKVPADLPGFIPGRAARLTHGKKEIGLLGEIHPSVLESFGLEQPVALFELDPSIFKKN
ncbi:MAG: hypothetical protein KGH63_05030, partial [Candidatus Micrarchaeota archaeon]|nr:hypothetical protein [Candidatus Micrarchaeota archaeon]